MTHPKQKQPPASSRRPRRRISWLRLPEPSAYAPAIRRLHEESRARLGYVRNFLRLPFEPDRLALYQGFLDRLMRSSDARLPAAERELLALVASVENRCLVCVQTHAAALRKHGMEAKLVDALTVSWHRADLAPRQRALAEFAWKLTARPAEADESYIGGLRAAGLKEAEILEAAQIVSIYNSNNRLNNVLGVRPNDEARAP